LRQRETEDLFCFFKIIIPQINKNKNKNCGDVILQSRLLKHVPLTYSYTTTPQTPQPKLLQGFTPKHAIPLSNVTVFGGSIANFILNRPKRHPEANRPLMDLDLILVMQPMTIAGALLGSFANKLLPEIILTVCLVILLVYTTKETLDKGFEVYAKETASKKAKESELSRMTRESNTKEEKAGLLEEGEISEKSPTLPPRELTDIYEEESGVPWWKLLLLWAMFAVVIAVNIVKVPRDFMNVYPLLNINV
jgi:hypothetical protein